MVAGGAPEDDAVFVHRDHARVEREDDQFFLRRLWTNSLEVNGQPVARHERVRITTGDDVTFSGVVTTTVRIEVDEGKSMADEESTQSLYPGSPEPMDRGAAVGIGVHHSLDVLVFVARTGCMLPELPQGVSSMMPYHTVVPWPLSTCSSTSCLSDS